MSKFKVGDKVRFNDNDDIAEVIEVAGNEIKVYWGDEGSVERAKMINGFWYASEFEPSQPKSPVVEKTVKSIEAGVYGRLRVEYSNNKVSVGIDRSHLDTEHVKHGTMMYEFTTSELEFAAKTFMELAQFLKENE